jgi:hypothetical protein
MFGEASGELLRGRGRRIRDRIDRCGAKAPKRLIMCLVGGSPAIPPWRDAKLTTPTLANFCNALFQSLR